MTIRYYSFYFLQVKDKFRLEMSEEQAVQYLQTLIDESIKAVFPELFERIHKLAMVRAHYNIVFIVQVCLFLCRTSKNSIKFYQVMYYNLIKLCIIILQILNF